MSKVEVPDLYNYPPDNLKLLLYKCIFCQEIEAILLSLVIVYTLWFLLIMCSKDDVGDKER